MLSSNACGYGLQGAVGFSGAQWIPRKNASKTAQNKQTRHETVEEAFGKIENTNEKTRLEVS